MQLQAAVCEMNPVTMRGGGPVNGGGGSINLHSLYNPMPGRQECSVNGVGSPEWNELKAYISSAVHLLRDLRQIIPPLWASFFS